MKRTKKLISILLAAIMMLGVFAVMPMAVSAATVTATENWAPDANGVYHIASPADLLAFGAAVNADSTYFSGKTVVLDADIDMDGVTLKPMTKFRGTLDGRGFAVKNLDIVSTSANYSGLFLVVDSDITVKNISFIDCTAKSSNTGNASRIGLIVGQVYNNTNILNLNFENVYVSGTITGVNHVGGFVGRADSATNMNFDNCVSAATIKAVSYKNASGATTWGSSFGGFVGTLGVGNTATVAMTDCVFMGSIPTVPNTASAFGGFTSANVKLERCLSLATIKKQQSADFFCFSNQSKVAKQTGALNVEFIDCYSFGTNSLFARSNAATSGHWSVILGNGYDVSIVYGGKEVYSHKDSTVTTLTKENGTYSKVAAMNAAFESFTDAITAESFAKLCPGLAESGKWALTQATVTHGGVDHASIMPVAVAKMIKAPIAGAPNATKHLQTRQNGDKYDIRFVGMVNVDNLADYESVGFKAVVKVKDTGAVIKSETVSGDCVYKAIKADGVDVSAEALGSKHVSVFQICGFKADTAYEISVLSFAKKADGTYVYDSNGALTLTVNNGQIVG